MARRDKRPHRRPVVALKDPQAAFERLKSKIKVVESGCWEWQFSLNSMGYPQLSFENRYHMGNRLMMLAVHGPFDPMLEVCHRCDNGKCINPDHLFLGTRSDNVRDSVQKRRHGLSKKDFCKRGHPLSGDNLDIRTHQGKRMRSCRLCDRIRQRLYAGWTEEQAMTLGKTPHGHRPVNGTFHKSNMRRGVSAEGGPK